MGYFEENLLKYLEENKIKIFSILISNNSNPRFIKIYVTKVWNICRMLNYTRNVKDTDHNYYLLRLKDFLCDLFLLIFSSSVNEISLQDVFNLIQMVVEVGTVWSKLEMNLNSEAWIRKIENIMKFLISKVNDIEMLIQLDKKYYSNFFEYLNFYIDNYLIKNNNKKFEENAKILIEEIFKIILLIKNVKFIQNDNDTRNLFINLLILLKNNIDSQFSTDNMALFFEGFESISYKNMLSNEIISEFYKIYVKFLMSIGDFSKSEEIIKIIIDIIPINSKEELEFFVINLEILILFYGQSNNKIKDMIDIIIEHKEFNFEFLEEIMILISNNKMQDLFFEIFINKIKNLKNLKFNNSNNSTLFNYENCKNFPNLNFIFLYSLFKTKLLLVSDIFSIINPNIQEILKIKAECLLDNYGNNAYNNEEHNNLIPQILKNIVILFIKIEKNNENFSNYFLLEILKKLKNRNEKEFIDLALEIYIEKKDYQKLRSIIQELKNANVNNSLFFYSQIILALSEGNKWNGVNNISNICLSLNQCSDFNVIFYIKIFQFLNSINSQDFSLIACILDKFVVKFLEIFNKKDFNMLTYEKNSSNITFLEIFYEILSFVTKSQLFSKQIMLFMDIFDNISDFLIELNCEESLKLIVSNFTIVIDIITLLLNYKNLTGHNSKNKINLKITEEFPEFILITCCKLFNFIFLNFQKFSLDFFEISQDRLKERVINFLELIEVYKSLFIFHISFEISCVSNNNENTNSSEKYSLINKTYVNFTQNFNDSLNFLKQKYSIIPEILDLINNRLEIITQTTHTIEEILKIKIMCKTLNLNDLEEILINYPEENIKNKKYLFVISSIIYQNGLKIICSKFTKKIINIVLSSQDLIGTVYSIEEVMTLYKDYIHSFEESTMKIGGLKEFSNLILKLCGKIEENLLLENLEWTLYHVFNLIDQIQKNDKDFMILRSIIEELNALPIKNRSFIITSLFEIIIKKFIL